MSVAVCLPPSGSPLPTLLLRRFSVDEYHQMVHHTDSPASQPVLKAAWKL